MESEPFGDATLVRVAGEVLSSNAEQFDEDLTAAMGKSPRVVLDLALVDMMSSSGLGTLIKHTERLGDPDRLVLVGLKPRVLEIFRALGLDQFFVLVDDIDDAREVLSRGKGK